VLWVDCRRWYPLGFARDTVEGKRRADRLEAAWTSGQGTLGYCGALLIWSSWPQFSADAQLFEAHPALALLGSWRQPLALAAAALIRILDALCPVAGHARILDITDETSDLDNW
jgi:hypothetical protein